MNESDEQLAAIYTTIKGFQRDEREKMSYSSRKQLEQPVRTVPKILPRERCCGWRRGASSGWGFIRIKSTSRLRYKGGLSLMMEVGASALIMVHRRLEHDAALLAALGTTVVVGLEGRPIRIDAFT